MACIILQSRKRMKSSCTIRAVLALLVVFAVLINPALSSSRSQLLDDDASSSSTALSHSRRMLCSSKSCLFNSVSDKPVRFALLSLLLASVQQGPSDSDLFLIRCPSPQVTSVINSLKSSFSYLSNSFASDSVFSSIKSTAKTDAAKLSNIYEIIRPLASSSNKPSVSFSCSGSTSISVPTDVDFDTR
jgi:hypothetical protein